MLYDKFCEACRRNEPCRAKTLLEGPGGFKIDLNQYNNSQKTPLCQSIENRSIKSVEFLLLHGADVHKTSVVSIHKPSSRSGEFLKYHEAPIVTAARLRNLPCLELLLENGCLGDESAILVEDVHTPGVEKGKFEKGTMSAVHWAVIQNEPKMLEMLLQSGGKAEVKDHEGRTPMHHACACKKNSEDYCNNQVEILRLLLHYGANPLSTDLLSVTPLALAINYGCLPSFESILTASPGSAAFYKLSMIGLATLKNRHDMVVRLVNEGFKLNILNSRFQTPIETEISTQPTGRIATTLIYHGCDVNCFHRSLNTPSLMYRVLRGPRLDCESIAFLLLKTGYDLNQDPWLLDISSPNNKEIVISRLEDIYRNNIETKVDKIFFKKETLKRYGGFNSLSIPAGRMTILKDYLITNLRNPRRLIDLSRISIRRCISVCNRGVSVVKQIKILPLPPSLVSFLLFGDVAYEQDGGSIQVLYPF